MTKLYGQSRITFPLTGNYNQYAFMGKYPASDWNIHLFDHIYGCNEMPINVMT